MKNTKKSETENGTRTYLRPIIKIIICLAAICVSINRGAFIQISVRWLSVVDTILWLIILLVSFWHLFDALGDLGDIYFDRKDAKRDIGKLKVKKYVINDIVAMARREDIIEIEIRFNGKIVKVGSASDCKPGRNDFFDKAYFCNAGKMEEIESIEEFRERLEGYSTEGILEVVSIDGVPVVDKKKKCINK